MPTPLPQIVSLVLAFVFAWSSSAKASRPRTWWELLGRYRLGPLRFPVAVGVPVAEAAVAILLFRERQMIGAGLALVLLAAFSAAILRLRSLEGSRLPCGCFGKTKTRDFRVVLGRNCLLALLSAAILLNGEDFEVFEGLGAPDGSDIIPVALGIMGIVAVIWLAVNVQGSFKKGQQ